MSERRALRLAALDPGSNIQRFAGSNNITTKKDRDRCPQEKVWKVWKLIVIDFVRTGRALFASESLIQGHHNCSKTR
jgi:hypothetical protein